ncbi:MAG TPA: hypothetical protein VIN75_03180 [Burkholderiaceae bacterium]
MNNKPLAILSPLCLALYAAGAQAALEPFSFNVSETVKHESNVAHQQNQYARADWISNSEIKAAIDEALGRGKLGVDAGANYNAYSRQDNLDSWGYHAGAQLDWETIGDLSGSFGADTSRRQYIDGVTNDILPLPGQTTIQTVIEPNNQTDDHGFARIQLGGPSRWQIFGGGDFNKRRFSASNFSSNDERQWSANFGTRYATSPDLVFGLVGNTTRGEFPHVATFSFGNSQSTEVKRFHTRSINGTVQLKATGNSEFDASLGYTRETSDLLASRELKFVNGSLNWTWTPPSHFTVKLGLKRSTDFDTSTTGLNNGVRYANSLNSPSVNNLALLDVTYALTAKVNLDANATYSQRKYSDVSFNDPTTGLPTLESGTLRTSTFFFTAHWQPTRTTDVSCGAGRERRSGSGSFSIFSYGDNTVRCTAAIRFD